jgi:hypothetical protein
LKAALKNIMDYCLFKAIAVSIGISSKIKDGERVSFYKKNQLLLH